MGISSTTVGGLHLELNHPMGTQRLDPYPDFHQQNGSLTTQNRISTRFQPAKNGSFNSPRLDTNANSANMGILTTQEWISMRF